jgi:N-acetylmuramoyl-L-alanine amidase
MSIDIRRLRVIMAALLIGAAYIASNSLLPKAALLDVEKVRQEQSDGAAGRVIVLDPGHGGYDSGKIAVTGTLEKDLNLMIVLELRGYLEDRGFEVVLTRDVDTGLYSDGDKNRKKADLKKRCEIINSSGAQAAVSIHLNSFTDSSVRGAQAFYYKDSVGGKQLASCIQQAFRDCLDGDNGRVEKSNDSYYLLLNTAIPVVIAECGFLSNREEAELIESAEYRSRLVEALGAGIVEYYGG